MSSTQSQISRRNPSTLLWLSRAVALLLIVYAVTYTFAIAPERFTAESGPLTIREVSSLKTSMLPLQLPDSKASLDAALHLVDDLKLRDAQLHLYQRALIWDRGFVLLYAAQLFTLLFLIRNSLRPKALSAAARIAYVPLSLALLAIVGATIFDLQENRQIAEILSLPPANELEAARQAVVVASTWKWAMWSASCLLLFVASWGVKKPSWLSPIDYVLLFSGLTAGLGIIPHWHGLLAFSALAFGLAPLIVTWKLTVVPPLRWLDVKVLGAAKTAWKRVELPEGMDKPKLSLKIFAGDPKRAGYYQWRAGGIKFSDKPLRATPKESSGSSPSEPSLARDERDDEPTE